MEGRDQSRPSISRSIFEPSFMSCGAMPPSSVQSVAVENPVLAARNGPEFGTAAYRVGVQPGVSRSTFHTGKDEMSLRLLLG